MAPTPTLILASTSPYRRSLLDRLSIDYLAVDPGVDEERWRDHEPEAMVRALARAKAEAVDQANALVIGSDQCVDLDGEVLGKPGTEERAVAQLERMSGRSHRLLTAVAVHDTRSGETRVDLDVHELLRRQPALLAEDRPGVVLVDEQPVRARRPDLALGPERQRRRPRGARRRSAGARCRPGEAGRSPSGAAAWDGRENAFLTICHYQSLSYNI